MATRDIEVSGRLMQINIRNEKKYRNEILNKFARECVDFYGKAPVMF